jgi:hypothetical protein
MKTLDFERDVQKTVDYDMDAAAASVTPRELTFTVDGEPRIEAGFLVVKGILENPTDRALSIVVFPVNGATPLYVALETNDAIRIAPSPFPRPPPAPPPPLRVEVPAKSRIAVEGADELAKYEWTGAPEATVRWSFQFWNDPKPQGTSRVKLPAK